MKKLSEFHEKLLKEFSDLCKEFSDICKKKNPSLANKRRFRELEYILDEDFAFLGVDTKATILKRHGIEVRVIEEPPTFAGDDDEEDTVDSECSHGETTIITAA